VSQPAVSRILSTLARLRELRRDDHSSRPGIADGLERPTRKLRTGRPLVRLRDDGETLLPYLVLLRAGFCLPSALQQTRCALTAPFHPYPPSLAGIPSELRRGRPRLRGLASTKRMSAKSGGMFSVPLVLQVTLTGRYPAHCPLEFGLSSRFRPFGLRRTIIWPTATFQFYRTREVGLGIGTDRAWTFDCGLLIPSP
jgi:hypothetical protein